MEQGDGKLQNAVHFNLLEQQKYAPQSAKESTAGKGYILRWKPLKHSERRQRYALHIAVPESKQRRSEGRELKGRVRDLVVPSGGMMAWRSVCELESGCCCCYPERSRPRLPKVRLCTRDGEMALSFIHQEPKCYVNKSVNLWRLDY